MQTGNLQPRKGLDIVNEIDKGMLIIPAVLPLDLNRAISIIRILQKVNKFDVIALQLDESHQEILSKINRGKKEIGEKL